HSAPSASGAKMSVTGSIVKLGVGPFVRLWKSPYMLFDGREGFQSIGHVSEIVDRCTAGFQAVYVRLGSGADITRLLSNVRFTQKRTFALQQIASLFDHIVGAGEQGPPPKARARMPFTPHSPPALDLIP